jgi:hypothetical protein
MPTNRRSARVSRPMVVALALVILVAKLAAGTAAQIVVLISNARMLSRSWSASQGGLAARLLG